jgi:hypothetical protein
MKRFAVAVAAFTVLGGVVAHMAPASGQSTGEAAATWPFRNLRAKSADLESVGFQWVAPGLFV